MSAQNPFEHAEYSQTNPFEDANQIQADVPLHATNKAEVEQEYTSYTQYGDNNFQTSSTAAPPAEDPKLAAKAAELRRREEELAAREREIQAAQAEAERVRTQGKNNFPKFYPLIYMYVFFSSFLVRWMNKSRKGSRFFFLFVCFSLFAFAPGNKSERASGESTGKQQQQVFSTHHGRCALPEKSERASGESTSRQQQATTSIFVLSLTTTSPSPAFIVGLSLPRFQKHIRAPSACCIISGWHFLEPWASTSWPAC